MFDYPIIANIVGGQGDDNSAALANAFETRVLADGGTFEGESCLTDKIRTLKNLGFYDKASLILTPNGYREGKIYSLLPTSGAGDFTFVRAGTAYRKGPSLVEQVPYNLIQYSEALNNAAYAAGAMTVTVNNTTAPDGTLTGTKLTPTAGAGTHSFFQFIGLAGGSTKGAAFTSVWYAKAAGYNWAYVLHFDGVTNSGVWFDLQNGVKGTEESGCTGTITSEGNGWYKLTVTRTASASGERAQIAAVTGNGASMTFSADGASGIYVWRPQMFTGSSSALSYFKTTNRFAVPKLDYTLGSCPDLLMEPQRTNLLLRSEEFDNASWTKFGSTAASNQTSAPNGVSTADSLLETTANSTHGALQSSVKAASSIQYTFSCYLKNIGRDWYYFQIDDGTNGWRIWFNLTTGVLGTNAIMGTGFTFQSASIEQQPNGFYRCIATITTNTATTIRPIIASTTADGNGAAFVGDVTKGFYAWGAQLEQASYATSYIPTTSATATRLADAITALSAAALIGQTEGTLYADFVYPATGQDSTPIEVHDTTQNERIAMHIFAGTSELTGFVVDNNVTQAAHSVVLTAGRHKAALVYRSNYCSFFVDGVKIGEDLTVTLPTTTHVSFSRSDLARPFYGRHNTAALSKTAISDAEAIILTTL